MNSMKKRIELLVPCGNKDAFYAAVKNGADAVYLGGKNFGARAFANNFSHEELEEVVKYAHLYGVKVYVTMNTMLLEDEIEPALKEARYLHEIGVDALIVQDLGFVCECRKYLPNLELHASTQMHIHNISGAKFAKELGLSRVVLARETTIDNIKQIAKKDVEVEVFVHGALCISYSGQCLMSSILFNRSGNRGMCAQCCRLQYRLYDQTDNRYLNLENEYLLSPKDLNTIENIKDLIEAGVASLKVEGRMKRPEYVALVTRLYRMAIDAYYEDKIFVINEKVIESLKLLFNRGFTKGHIFGADSNELYNHYRPNHQGIKIGKIIGFNKGQIHIKLSKSLNQGDGLRIIDGKNEYGIIANKIYKNSLLVNQAFTNDVIALDYPEFINKDAQVLKTTDIKLHNEINNYDFYRKVDVNVSFDARIGLPLKILVDDGMNRVESYSDFIIESAKKLPITKEKMIENISKVNDTAFNIKEIDGIIENIFIPIKSINETRRKAFDLLTKIRETSKKEIIIKERFSHDLKSNSEKKFIFEVTNQNQINILEKYKSQIIIVTNDYELAKTNQIIYVQNNINENSNYLRFDNKDIVISEFGGLNQKAFYIASNLNVANSYSVEILMKLGAKGICLSSELNEIQINHLVNGFKKRYDYIPNIYNYAYGRRNLMYLKRSFLDVYKDMVDFSHKYELVDTKQRHFPLIYNDGGILKILEDQIYIDNNNYDIGKYVYLYDENHDDIMKIIKELDIKMV